MRLSRPRKSSLQGFPSFTDEKTYNGDVPRWPYTIPSDWLRSVAISALSDKSPAHTAMIQKLARKILNMNKYQGNAPDSDILEDYVDNHGRPAGRAVPNERRFSALLLASLQVLMLFSSN